MLYIVVGVQTGTPRRFPFGELTSRHTLEKIGSTAEEKEERKISTLEEVVVKF